MNEKERNAWTQHGMRRRRHPLEGLAIRATWSVLALIAAYWAYHLARWIVIGAELP